MSLIKNKDELLKIKIALEDNFPDSFQLFNIVQLILTEDGIEREEQEPLSLGLEWLEKGLKNLKKDKNSINQN